MNHTWAYKGYDNDWKLADEIYEIMKKVNSHGINLLVNVGLDYLGKIPAPSVDILKELGKLIKENNK